MIALQWCNSESTAAWTALLERIPAPRVVVIDGGRGLASALAACWPQTRVQRCLVHVQRDARRYLTLQPRTEAGKSLRRLSLQLTGISTVDAAITWTTKLHQWHQVYEGFLAEKTYADQDGAIRPTTVKAGAKWWWTHERIRKAYNLMENLVQKKTLFTYLDPVLADLDIASTTNRIEGGVNSQIKELLHRHRGMTSKHQRRAAEWWCYLHSNNPAPPTTLIRPEHWHPTAVDPVEEPVFDGWGTAINERPNERARRPEASPDDDTNKDTNDGVWIRKGWGGR